MVGVDGDGENGGVGAIAAEGLGGLEAGLETGRREGGGEGEIGFERRTEIHR